MPRLQFAFAVAASAMLIDAAAAQDQAAADFLSGTYARLGILASHEADEGTLTLGGMHVPGADFVTDTTFGVSLEAGVMLNDKLGISVFGTTPLTTPNVGTGTLTGVGNLGDGTVGYYGLTGHIHVPIGDLFVPYIGGGVGYMHVFGTEDGAISGLSIEPAFGAVLQAGIDVPINEHLGVFVDAKKLFISTDVTGTFNGLPAVARTRVDPWIISAGVSVGF